MLVNDATLNKVSSFNAANIGKLFQSTTIKGVFLLK